MKKIIFIVLICFFIIPVAGAAEYNSFFKAVTKLHTAGKSSSAIASLDRQLWGVKNPPNVVAKIFLVRGIIRKEIGEYENAVSDLNMSEERYNALELKPGDNQIVNRESVYFHRGVCQYFLGDYILAKKDLSRSITSRYKTLESYLFRGKCQYFLGKFDLAISDLKNSGKSWDAYNLLGWIYATSKFSNPKLAVQYSLAACTFKFNPYSLDTLAAAHAANSEWNLAKKLQEYIILINADAQFKEHLSFYQQKKLPPCK